MGHGKHCYCIICKTGKSLGILKVCESNSCPHPSHKKKSKTVALKIHKATAKKAKRKVTKKKKK